MSSTPSIKCAPNHKPQRVWVRGVPATQGSKTAYVLPSGRVVVTDANRRLRDWRQAVTFALQAWQGGVLEGPLELRLSFVLTRPKSAPKSAYWVAKRPDLVKLARAVEDACRGVVMRDDAQVASLRAEKRYALPGEPTGVVIEAVPLQSPARASHSRSRVRSSRQRRQP